MNIDQKILDSLIGLLADNQSVNIHSLSKRGGFDRSVFYYRINKLRERSL